MNAPPVWFTVMCALFLLGLSLWVTALVRVRGDHWRTSVFWMAAGWAAYLGGLCVMAAGRWMS